MMISVKDNLIITDVLNSFELIIKKNSEYISHDESVDISKDLDRVNKRLLTCYQNLMEVLSNV
ncbi:MAG: hypothetical protein ACK5HL_04305 [Bacilli bacterium]